MAKISAGLPKKHLVYYSEIWQGKRKMETKMHIKVKT